VILVVEDDPQVARLIALVLRRAGRQCEIVADGQSALQKAKEL
jgi:CheY-like chemotaxis protein